MKATAAMGRKRERDERDEEGDLIERDVKERERRDVKCCLAKRDVEKMRVAIERERSDKTLAWSER